MLHLLCRRMSEIVRILIMLESNNWGKKEDRFSLLTKASMKLQ